jgi:hypothetical protein
VNSERPIATTDVTAPPKRAGVAARVKAPEQLAGEHQREERAEPHRPGPQQRVDPLVELGVLVRRIEQHDHEQEEDHDRAGVDDDLNHRHEWRIEQHVEAGQRAERGDQEQDAVDRVPLRDDEQRRADGDRPEQIERDSLRAQNTALRPRSRAG